MSDKLIRELLINVKQKGASATAKSIQKVADGLVDAASAAELANEQLNKMPKSIYSIERAAERATKSLSRMQAFNPKGSTKGLQDMATSLLRVEASIMDLADATRAGFTDMVRASNSMSGSVGRQLESLNDRLYDTGRAIGSSTTAFGRTVPAAAGAARAIGNTSGSARGATRDFAAMSKSMGGLPMLYAMIASNVFVLKSAFEQLKMGDQLNRLEEFGKIVGTTTGTPVQSLAAGLQEAAGYAISFEEAMKQASVASAYGFSSEQLNQFGLVARRAAATLGIDMVDALNRVIKGVSKQEIELLDELGVTIRLNDAYANYVKQLNAANTGITYKINNLSTFQKQQAYANAVVEESTRRFSHLDSVLRATPWEQFAANADSALRKIQQAAAKYLTPVINSINAAFYTSQASISQEQGRAQMETNRQIDANNQAALALGLSSTREGYDKALKLYGDAVAKRDKQQAEFNARMAKSSSEGQAAVRLVMQGVGASFAAFGTSEENQQVVRDIANMGLEIEKLNKEINDSTPMLKAWADADATIGKKVSESNTGLAKRIQLQQDATDPKAAFDYNNAVLKGIVEEQKAYDQTRKTAQDLNNDIQNVAQSTDTASKTSATLAATLRTIESLSGGDDTYANKLVKDLNLGYETLQDMSAATKALDGYVKSVGDKTSNQLAVAKEIDKVYKATGDKKKAEAAGTALELRQLSAQETALRNLLATNKGNKGLEKEIQSIQLEKLKLTNSEMEAAKKIKDVRDKIVGVDREIALLNNRTMTDSQYNVARLKMELEIEKDKLKILEGRADKERDYEQSRRNIAQLEREIWKEQLDRNSQTAAARQDALNNELAAKPLMGEAERMQAQLDFYKQMKEFTAGNANEQLRWNQAIAQTTAQMAALNAQRQAQMQAGVASSLGGDYTPTTGMTGEDKAFADMTNKMASYDTAISKLGELNSEAVAVAQSMGNLTNAMMQFSQGSLDTTSTIAAGMQMVSSMISAGVSNQVTAIDAAIAAEQKRDGKSEASKAKLKKLEAEKIKIQQDAAKKQIIIQTAVAVMQAATAVPYPWSIPLMIAAGLAGAMSLAQASSATSMSSIGDSGDTASYLTLGERQKNVDVSMSANAGEASYMRGDQGIGSANSFVPRAEGGNMYPGVSYQMGEHGTEIATPMVPMKATPADEVNSKNSGDSRMKVNLTVQTMDAASFMDFALNNSGVFNAAVEAALNEKGQSLNSLGQ